MAALCAAATNQIRLGTGIIVAPLHKPIRVLAEISITDILFDARLELWLAM